MVHTNKLKYLIFKTGLKKISRKMMKKAFNEVKFDYLDIDLGLRKVLNESMCVADNISINVDELLQRMWNATVDMERKPLKDYKNIMFNQIGFPFDITDRIETTVVCRFLYFNSQPECDRFIRQNPISKPKFIRDKNVVYTNVLVVRNWFDSQKIAGSLQHELLHAYNKLSGEEYDAQVNWTPERKKGREKNFEKNERLYNTSIRYMNSPNSTLKSVSIAIYLSFHGEISAFTNGLYKRLYPVFVKKFFSTYDEVLYSDPMYKHYLILKNFCKRIDDGNVPDLEKAVQLYNMSEGHIEKLCKHTLQRLERGIAYAVQKAKLDFENDVFRSPSNIE